MAKHQPKKYFDAAGNLIIKPYRLIDLAAIFDVNHKTMHRWISKHPQELGRRDGYYFSVQQVRFCIEQFGLPQKINVAIPMKQSKAT
jgi:hypothetical protein